MRPCFTKNSSETSDEEEYECSKELYHDENISFGFIEFLSDAKIYPTAKPPNIEHELEVAKNILKEASTLTGDNLFDHLCDLIKCVIEEKPKNIVDYVEELSFNIRQKKFHVPERFPWDKQSETINIEFAKANLQMMNLPETLKKTDEYDVCQEEKIIEVKKSSKSSSPKNEVFVGVERKLSQNENVPRLYLLWSMCGFNLQPDEILKLEYSLKKIQFHAAVTNARFWGKVYGLKKPYYIVEAILTQSEIDLRLEKSTKLYKTEEPIAGINLQYKSENEFNKMNSSIKPIPIPISSYNKHLETDIPPEIIGTGLNNRTYFVVNSLNEEWIELLNVTPKQIQVSRSIKKFLTGNLENTFWSHPSFQGSEQHYLRAIISRITCSTYVAPKGYYIKNIKEHDEEHSIDKEADNFDAMIQENSKYKVDSQKLEKLKNWVHIRSNILEQGRATYFKNDEKSLVEVTKTESEEDVFDEETDNYPENEPTFFTPCSQDKNEENVPTWSIRCSSIHSKAKICTILRSNLWPGAYSFTCDKYCDSIYFGWAVKYTKRNMSFSELSQLQSDKTANISHESFDPSFEMEEDWQEFQKPKLKAVSLTQETSSDDETIC